MRAAVLAFGLAVVLAFSACDGSEKDSARVVLRPVGSVTGEELDGAVEVMRARLDKLGVGRAKVERSDHTVILRLPRSRVKSAVPVLTRPGRFEVFDFQGNLVGPSLDDSGYAYPLTSRPKLRANTVILTCGNRVRYCPAFSRARGTYYYLIRYNPENETFPAPELTDADIQLEDTHVNFDPNGGGDPAVDIEFTESGAQKFQDLTRTLAERGRVFHDRVGGPDELAFQQLAIVIDGEIKSAPIIDYRENPEGISGNAAQITGFRDLREAKEFALVLQTGALPVRFQQITE
jgi:preprotein translocase subunit SecD